MSSLFEGAHVGLGVRQVGYLRPSAYALEPDHVIWVAVGISMAPGFWGKWVVQDASQPGILQPVLIPLAVVGPMMVSGRCTAALCC